MRGHRGLPARDDVTSPERLSQAVERLYRALHLPRPGVVIATDATAFVEHVVTVTRRASCDRSYALLALALALALLALAGAALVKDDVAGLAFLVVGTLGIVPMALMVMGDRFDGLPWWDLLVVFGFCASLPGIGCALLTTNLDLAVGAAAMGLLIAMVAGLSIIIVGPFARRFRLRRRFALVLPLLGSRHIQDAVRTRVTSMLTDMQEQKLLGGRARDTEPRQALELRQLLSSIGEARLSWHWRTLGPVLGAAAGSSTRRFLYTVEPRARDVPELARAAIDLDEICEAITLFEHVAVVLPSASTTSEMDNLPRPRASWRRSRRPIYADVLRTLGPQPILALMIDLAGSDEGAERLLAQRLLRLSQPEIMGLERLAAAASLDPVDRNEAGELFVLGQPEHLVAFIRLIVREGDERWLRVPSYVTTTREGMAAAEHAGCSAPSCR